MAKIAIIGAGSLVFCKALTMDFLATDVLKGCELCLMSRTRPKLDRMEKFLKRVIKDNDLPAAVWSTLDRREALKDADYVVITIQVGGVEAFKHDYEIPLKYDVDQCIGDSLGPGGIFRALRTIPVLLDIAKDMEELCPSALMLQYANPMGANCYALNKAANIEYVGLCHGAQTSLALIGGYTGVAKDQIDCVYAGINHMGWFMSLKDKRDGRDLYPILREKMEQPEYYVNEKVRGEVMRHFGYFMTESTGHLSEYVPWFRSHVRSLKQFCDQPAFGGESGAYYKHCAMLAKKFKDTDYLALEETKLGERSVEFCTYIVEAIETGVPFDFYGNVENKGYITNLPDGCCVEVPIRVDGDGLHPISVGDLPLQCAALCQSNVTVQGLTAEAGITGDPEMAMLAIAMDPLTSAVCTLPEVRDMTRELLEAQREWLPQFEGKTLRETPPISIPEDVKPVEVPLDPALAIAVRFAELAKAATE